MEEQQTLLVVCPLKSTVEDLITEAQSMGISAALAASVSDAELRTANFQRANARQHFTCNIVCLLWFCILTSGEC